MKTIPQILGLLIFIIPVFAFAGDPIPGIGITVEQSPPGIKKSGTTNPKGQVVLSGFKPGPVIVSVKHGGRTAVIGKTGKDRIILPGQGRANVKPIRLELSLYGTNQTMKKGYDHYQAQSANRQAQAGKGNGNLKANHNTTRANRLTPGRVDTKGPGGKGKGKAALNRSAARALDTDDDGDSIPTTKAQDYNSSRSNTTTAIEVEQDMDQDPVVEITPMPGGRLKIVVTGN